MTTPVSNEDRASRARVAAMNYARQAGLDPRTDGWDLILTDLFRNLVHLSNEEGVPWLQVFRMGMVAYQADTAQPLPFVLVDGWPVEDFDPNQPPVEIQAFPTEEAAWISLQELPDADTGRYRIVQQEVSSEQG